MSKKIVKPKKKLKRTFFMFCEGETEVSYFSILRQQKDYNIMIQVSKKGQIPTSSKAKLTGFKNKLFTKSSYSPTEITKTNSHFFVLVDADVYSQTDIKNIKSTIEDEHTTVIFSNQDIELWILLHLKYYNKSDGAYIGEIEKQQPDYKKGGSNFTFFENIINNYLENAVKNSRKLSEFHQNSDRDTIKEMNPYTEVYRVIEQLK